MVDRLENTGLAERQPHPTDRRKRFVELTLDGEQATRAIYSDLGGQLHAIYAQLRPNQQDGVEKFLSQCPQTWPARPCRLLAPAL